MGAQATVAQPMGGPGHGDTSCGGPAYGSTSCGGTAHGGHRLWGAQAKGAQPVGAQPMVAQPMEGTSCGGPGHGGHSLWGPQAVMAQPVVAQPVVTHPVGAQPMGGLGHGGTSCSGPGHGDTASMSCCPALPCHAQPQLTAQLPSAPCQALLLLLFQIRQNHQGGSVRREKREQERPQNIMSQLWAQLHLHTAPHVPETAPVPWQGTPLGAQGEHGHLPPARYLWVQALSSSPGASRCSGVNSPNRKLS